MNSYSINFSPVEQSIYRLELAVKLKTRQIAGSNIHGVNKRKGLAKLLEKIISDGKLRGVIGMLAISSRSCIVRI